jgi:nucleotide-binding universal stress UspA family protein
MGVRSGPVLIAFDGSPEAEHAVREAGALLDGQPAVVVTVWKAGVGMELVELPAASIGLPPASIDVRTAMEIDRSMAERAERIAQKGADLAREAGFDEPEALAVADEVDVPVNETIVDVAKQRDARAVVVGAHGHGAVAEVLLGSISRGVIKRAPCPAVVVRHADR